MEEAVVEAIEEVVDEALDEVGLQSQSAAELGSDSPAPIPSVPPGVLRQRHIGVLPSGEVSLTAKDRSAIEDSVDELGMQSQSAPGPGSDSPAPAPSAPLFTGARRFRLHWLKLRLRLTAPGSLLQPVLAAAVQPGIWTG